MLHSGAMKRLLPVFLLAPLLASASDDIGDEPPPRTWAEVGKRYQTECPVPFFTLEKPEARDVGGVPFELRGADLVRKSGRIQGAFRLGVLGAVKEASAETRENLRRAAAEFRKRGVTHVVANGDISEGEFDLQDAFNMLGEEVPLPVFVFIGNSEGKGSFTRAYLRSAEAHPNLVNMNWVRHVDLGGVHLFSMPGYFNMKFLHGKAGCHYTPRDVAALEKEVGRVPRGDVVILAAHGPPLSFGKAAIDVAQDAGNVGDPDLARLVEDAGIPFGVFGHILEAGGRATTELKTGKPVKFPMKAPADHLYLNAGSVSATPWAMLDGKQSLGMAAVLTVQDGRGTAEFITLRK